MDGWEIQLSPVFLFGGKHPMISRFSMVFLWFSMVFDHPFGGKKLDFATSTDVTGERPRARCGCSD